MAEILHQLIGGLSHYLHGFIHLRWCRIFSHQRTPKKVARVIRYPGLGVRSVGPVGDFLENSDTSCSSMFVKDFTSTLEVYTVVSP